MREFLRWLSGDSIDELYDLASDPDELDNKVADPAYASDLNSLGRLTDRLKICAGDACWIQF